MVSSKQTYTLDADPHPACDHQWVLFAFTQIEFDRAHAHAVLIDTLEDGVADVPHVKHYACFSCRTMRHQSEYTARECFTKAPIFRNWDWQQMEARFGRYR